MRHFGSYARSPTISTSAGWSTVDVGNALLLTGREDRLEPSFDVLPVGGGDHGVGEACGPVNARRDRRARRPVLWVL